MDVLIVGAGAVGAVLGFHLARGGARTSYLVRPRHAEELAGGLTMYPMNRRRPTEPVPFTGFGVLVSAAEAARPWDYVVIATSSPALRAGTWLDELVAGIGDAAVVGIQAGAHDHEFVRSRVGAERVVWGMFSLMSWAADPAHDGVPRPGTAYWRPPLSSLPWSGPRAAPFAEALARGGLPSRTHPDVQRELAFAGPLLDAHTLALECAGFGFAATRADRDLLADAHAALRDSVALAVAVHGGRAPLWASLLRPWMSRLALALAPRITRFDIEAFFRRHYTKVGEQTIEGLRDRISLARERGVPTEGLGRMLARLEARRSAA